MFLPLQKGENCRYKVILPACSAHNRSGTLCGNGMVTVYTIYQERACLRRRAMETGGWHEAFGGECARLYNAALERSSLQNRHKDRILLPRARFTNRLHCSHGIGRVTERDIRLTVTTKMLTATHVSVTLVV